MVTLNELVEVVESPFGVRIAAPKTKLTANPDTIQNEILAQLYRQHPYLGKYTVNFEIKSSNEDRGILLGVFSLSSPMPSPISWSLPAGTKQTGDTAEADALASSDPNTLLRVPVIVRDMFLEPMDVFIDAANNCYPLTEQRVAAATFSNNMLGIASRQQQQQAASGDLYGTNNFDTQLRGFNMRSEGFLNQGNAVKLSMVMDHVGASSKDVRDFIDTVTSDRWLASCARNPLVQVAYEKVASLCTTKQRASTSAFVNKKPTVIVRSGSSAKIKTASGGEAVLTAQELQEMRVPSGDSIWERLLTENAILISGPSLISDAGDPPAAVESSGLVSLSSLDGEEKVAAAIAEPVSLTGTKIANWLLVANTGVALKERVFANTQAPLNDTLTKLASADYRPDMASGQGFFVTPSGQVTGPVTVTFSTTDANTGDAVYSISGDPDFISEIRTSTITKIAAVNATCFMPRGSVFINLPVDPTLDSYNTKLAAANETTLYHDGDSHFHVSGGPAQQLGVEGITLENIPDTMLVLGCLGADDFSAKVKIAEALQEGSTRFNAVIRSFSEERDFVFDDTDVADIRQDTVKTAAALLAAAEPDSVDAVLSLNFITPDNVLRATEAIPAYEQALSSICKLVINVRLGLREVPEDACLSAMRGLARAIDGLKRLQVVISQET